MKKIFAFLIALAALVGQFMPAYQVLAQETEFSHDLIVRACLSESTRVVRGEFFNNGTAGVQYRLLGDNGDIIDLGVMDNGQTLGSLNQTILPYATNQETWWTRQYFNQNTQSWMSFGSRLPSIHSILQEQGRLCEERQLNINACLVESTGIVRFRATNQSETLPYRVVGDNGTIIDLGVIANGQTVGSLETEISPYFTDQQTWWTRQYFDGSNWVSFADRLPSLHNVLIRQERLCEEAEEPTPSPTATPSATPAPQVGKQTGLGYNYTCSRGDFEVTVDLTENNQPKEDIKVKFTYAGQTKDAETNKDGRAYVYFGKSGNQKIEVQPEDGYPSASINVVERQCDPSESNNSSSGQVLGTSTTGTGGQVLGASTLADTGNSPIYFGLLSMAAGAALSALSAVQLAKKRV